MYNPIHSDTVQFKGPVANQNFYKSMHFCLSRFVFILANSADPDEILSGSSLFAKERVYAGIPNVCLAK